jgi:sulfur carrier protein ThiS
MTNIKVPPTNKGRRFNWPRIFGYDFFISFKLGPPPIGAQSYASDLARRLRELDFTVFYSEEEAPPGARLDTTLLKALHRSRILVVVANEGSLVQSQWVRKEVEEFRRKHPKRSIITINVDRAIENYGTQAKVSDWLNHDDKIWLDETKQAVEEGIASSQLVKRLVIAPNFIRSNTRLRWSILAIILMLIGLASWAGFEPGKLTANSGMPQPCAWLPKVGP